MINSLKISEKWIIKSGTDFREFSKIELVYNKDKAKVTKIEKYVIDSNIPEKPEITQIVNSYLSKIQD